jgi:uncharacterized protein (TIGR03083 family)
MGDVPSRPSLVLDAVAAQSAWLVDWSVELSDVQLRTASVLPGWSVDDVFRHLSIGIGMLPEAVGRPAPKGTKPLPVHEYVRAYAASSSDIAKLVRDQSHGGATSGVQEFERAVGEVLAVARGVSGDPVLIARRGPLRFDDVLRTRLIEFVVHGRDLARSLPGIPSPVEASALRIVTKTFAEALAARYPGRSVELRVPPYVAVQMVEGTTHTRGTPPNVVEMDAGTFVDMASGRRTFAESLDSGAVRASGTRADLGPYLPVLA